MLNFRKPKAGEFVITRLVDGRTFVELGSQVIRDFLTSHPGATKDRIYDELVSRMVQSGKMEAHDFDALLRSVAEEVQEPVKENLSTTRSRTSSAPTSPAAGTSRKPPIRWTRPSRPRKMLPPPA